MKKRIIEYREVYTSPLAEEIDVNKSYNLLASLSIVADFEDFEEGDEL